MGVWKNKIEKRKISINGKWKYKTTTQHNSGQFMILFLLIRPCVLFVLQLLVY